MKDGRDPGMERTALPLSGGVDDRHRHASIARFEFQDTVTQSLLESHDPGRAHDEGQHQYGCEPANGQPTPPSVSTRCPRGRGRRGHLILPIGFDMALSVR